MKLRHRLTLTFTTLSAVVLLVSFGTAIVLEERTELRQLDEELFSEATLVGEQLFERRDANGRKVVAIARLAALYERDGRLREVTDDFTDVPTFNQLAVPTNLPRDGAYRNLRNATEPMRAILFETRQGRYLLLAVSRRSIDDDLAFLYRVFGALFVLGALATALSAHYLGSRLARDVERVAATARTVAAGDLKVRVPASRAFSSELRALAADLDHMIAQLDEVMTAQRTFVSHAAHELRSPLATLRGELQLVLRHPHDVDEYRTSVESALAEVNQLIALAEDLLTMARSTNAAGSAAVAALTDVVSEAVRAASGSARARSIRLVGADDLPAVDIRGRARDVARALRNLIDNAVSHSADGGTVRLTVDRSDDKQIRIVVADDGPGVPDADREQIFAPFYRGAREQETSGAGLGLAIARQIARQHGGEVTLLPTGSGAQFALDLALA